MDEVARGTLNTKDGRERNYMVRGDHLTDDLKSVAPHMKRASAL